MLIEGSEVVTRSTQLAARQLTVLGVSIFTIWYYDIPLRDLSILGVTDLPVKMFGVVGAGILIFTFVSLILNWNADRVSFQKWYKVGKPPLATWGGSIANKPNSETLRECCDRICEQIKELEVGVEGEETLVRRMKEIEGELVVVNRTLEQQGRDFASLTFHGKFLLFGWYFLVPIFSFILGAYAVIEPFGLQNLSVDLVNWCNGSAPSN
ncbi:hypothetical protein K3722_00470 [Leisingera caerulea]|uniref:Uncharacterized protein n=1 Tax=Leisingera caerulea TaxID=506591 RepID=A0ABY5WWE4_LEICA|nr:hypothetical protein [Leisingera caerulea]UWQ58642.1 hypothetical protein K3722_00470 [Leisingera caerulea]